jgi:hypothetical protein
MLCVRRSKSYNHYEPQQDTNNTIPIFLEGTQAISARLSDKDKMGVKTLVWWMVKAYLLLYGHEII